MAMNYASFMIRRTRLEKNWSQEGLCREICTASYLSKIEQGKAEPSGEILRLLFARLGICWNGAEEGSGPVQEGYDLLFSGEKQLLEALVGSESFLKWENSPLGLDCMLLRRCAENGPALDRELETLMEPAQLALQRLLQERWEEAIGLCPCSYTYYRAGFACYHKGDFAHAVEYMYRAVDLASEEGRVRIMLMARAIMGNCYANLNDLVSMQRHYTAAGRLARALGNEEILQEIRYNTAATCIEAGRYEEAMAYFQTQRDSDSRIVLHKLAVCCEKLGRRSEGLAALDRAEGLPDHSAEGLESRMCWTVRLRLTDPEYLDSEAYGKALTETFDLCRRYAPVGFCLFHMPWMIEWYEHRRQYKQVAALMMEFPEFHKNYRFKQK